MDLKRIAKDTAKVLTSYLTYQAVRTVMMQLRETNLPMSYRLNEVATRESLQDGERFLEVLFQEQPELALRIMGVRLYLAEEVAEFLPEMVTTGIQQGNMEHQKKHLERITGMTVQPTPSEPGKEPPPKSNSPQTEGDEAVE
ncbi:MAG: chaperonin family protein RbcX [Cyanobacteria bacterium P01_H01_bin.119]